MKGTFKAGFKYFSNIFVVKEREIEIEIGGPTDVKHVAHIGWDGQAGAGTAPTWMNEFKAGPDFTVPSINSSGSEPSPWSSQESVQSGPEFCNEGPQATTEAPSEAPKKPKRKKLKSSASTASRSARATKPKTKLGNNNETTNSMKVEVATY